MRLLKLASARPVSRIHANPCALPQPFVPGTDPLVTPLEGTRAGLRAKRSPAASQLTEMSPPRLCWALSPLGIRYRFLSSIASWALLPPLRLCYHISESVASRALLSPLGLYRLRQRALLSLTPSRAPLLPLGRYCPSSSAIASRALSPLGLYRPSGQAITSWALSPLGPYCLSAPLRHYRPWALLSPLWLYCLSLGLYCLLGSSITSWATSPLGLCYRLSGSIAYCLSGSAIASQALLPLGLRYCPLGLYPLGLCPPTDRVTLSTATISIRVSSPALRQQSITLCM